MVGVTSSILVPPTNRINALEEPALVPAFFVPARAIGESGKRGACERRVCGDNFFAAEQGIAALVWYRLELANPYAVIHGLHSELSAGLHPPADAQIYARGVPPTALLVNDAALRCFASLHFMRALMHPHPAPSEDELGQLHPIIR